MHSELTSKNLKEVRALLYKIREKWFDIGVELDINIGELNAIKVKNDNRPSDCLLEVIKLWLQSSSSAATWKTLASALKSEVINEKEVAREGLCRSLICC